MMQQIPEKERKFIVDEKVLYHDLAKELWYNRKLEPKWKELYQIVAVLLNKSYKIADQRGVLQISINEDRLKLYNCQSLKSIIIIENI